MKIYEIRQMKNEEINQRIKDEENNLLDLRFSHALKQLTNTAKLRLIRRDISKMRTILNERELEEQNKVKKD